MINAMPAWNAERMKRLAWIALLIALCGLLALSVQAQSRRYSSQDGKAIKLYEQALENMRQQKWQAAESDLKRAIGLDERFVEPRFALAELYADQGRSAQAITAYREALALSPRFFPNAYLHLAELEFRDQQYTAAEQHYGEFMKLSDDAVRRARAELGMRSCAFAREAVKNPVPFEPRNLGPGVNTKQGEYYPCVTADDQLLLFTRDVHDGTPPYGHQEDFFMSYRDAQGQWGKALPWPLNLKMNEGAGTLSPDGRFLIFTACSMADGTYGAGRKGLGSCDLFISRRVGERWSPPENLGPPVNSRAWESQPSLGSDGRTLYFIRGMQAMDGIKGMDIFMSRLQDDGSWSKPERLGEHINTSFQEESVQIHPDGRTLFFSSNGHPGMGGLDIFVSRMQDDGTWGQAENLGYPINTGADENSLVVSADGLLAYFASDRPGGQGDLDLYSFALYEQARPVPVSFVKGRVFDKESRDPLEADVMLFDLSTGKMATAAYSDPRSGEFLVCLPTGRTYALNAGTEGYLFFSQNYDVQGSGTAVKPFTLDVPMEPLKAGATIALRNIFFATGSAALLPTSNAELDQLSRLLFVNPTLRLELSGHTDNVGDDASNQKLSDQRANAVRDYLLGKGIEAARLVAKGYGESRPMTTNDTEEGRALNRRTEITVL